MLLLTALKNRGFNPYANLSSQEADALDLNEWMQDNLSERVIADIDAAVREATVYMEELQASMEDVHPMQAQQDFERRCYMDEQSEKHFNNRPPY